MLEKKESTLKSENNTFSQAEISLRKKKEKKKIFKYSKSHYTFLSVQSCYFSGNLHCFYYMVEHIFQVLCCLQSLRNLFREQKLHCLTGRTSHVAGKVNSKC